MTVNAAGALGHSSDSFVVPGGSAASVMPCLSPEERTFFELEMAERSFESYVTRLRRLGLSGHDRVLDLACGMGQWTLALASMSGAVIGVDKSISRLMLATALAKDHGYNNVEFRWSKMEALNLETGSIDVVFCYGAFMFARRDQVVREIVRVLRPGGLAYLNANGWGWYLWRLSRALTGKLPARHIPGIAMVLASSLVRAQRNVAYSPSGLAARLTREGLEVVAQGPEGSIGGGEPFYPARLLGLPGVFEFLCRRR